MRCESYDMGVSAGENRRGEPRRHHPQPISVPEAREETPTSDRVSLLCPGAHYEKQIPGGDLVACKGERVRKPPTRL